MRIPGQNTWGDGFVLVYEVVGGTDYSGGDIAYRTE